MATFLNSQIDVIGNFLSPWDWLLGRRMPEMCQPRKNQKRAPCKIFAKPSQA